jgi:peptidoglycan/LPS O-acetylase OafA/YrhL
VQQLPFVRPFTVRLPSGASGFPHTAPAPRARHFGPTHGLDALRGLAALAVVFTHVLSMGPPLGPEALALLDATPLRAVHTGRAPVVFFFVLSGYVLALSLLRPDAPGPAVFALRRTLRLLPPVAGAVLLSAGLRALFYQGPILDGGWDVRDLWSEPVGLSMLARQALLLGADGWFTLDIPLWSLVHEWRLSLVFPLVLLFRRRVALLLAAALALHAAAVAAGVVPNAVQLGPRVQSTVLASAYFVLPFAAGAALAFGGGRLALRGRARWAAWAGFAAAAALPWDLGYIAASAALIVLVRGPGLLPRALAAPAPLWLGRVSFSLYLVHMPVLAAAVHATHGLLPPWGALAVGVPASLLAAAAFHAWVEAPAHGLSRRVGRRGAAGPAAGAHRGAPAMPA